MALPSLPSFPTFPAMKNLPETPFPDLASLATSKFSAGPKEEVATADIYKIIGGLRGSKTITSIQELNAAIESNILGVKLAAGDTADFLSKIESGYLSIDKDLLTNRLLGCSNEFKSAYSELSDKMKKGSVFAAYKDQAKSLISTVNEVKSVVDAAKINDVRALGNFINKYTGTKVFSGKDKGAISGLLNSVITTASDLGVGNVFKTITDTLNDNGLIGRVTRGVLPVVMKNSDYKLLREISSSPAASLINVFSPGFTKDFSKAFTYRPGNVNTLTSFEDVFTSFENIDTKWKSIDRGDNGIAINALAMVSGSRDFQSLVNTGIKYWTTEQNKPGGISTPPPVPVDPIFLLATAYREVTVGDAIKRDFPKVALLNEYNGRLPSKVGKTAGMRTATNVKPVDPRVLQNSVGALLGF